MLLAAACSSPAGPAGGPSLDRSPRGDAPPIDHPPIDPEVLPVTAASARRLSIAQLRGSFPVALGTDADGAPITWRLPNGDEGLQRMSGSLGEADYLEVTEEDREPSTLYAKFMDDAARSVCDQALAADAGRAPAERAILRHVEPADTTATNLAAVDRNLRYLKLRMHGIKVQEGDDAPIAPLRALFDAAVAEAAAGEAPDEGDVALGWRAVCVALVVAPEFHLY